LGGNKVDWLKKTIELEIRKINKIFSGIIIVVNIFFLPTSIIQINTCGGPMGIGLMILPYTLFINIFLIPAILIFKGKNENKISFLIINSVGIISAIFFFCFNFVNLLKSHII
jgi:hypothetical protein